MANFWLYKTEQQKHKRIEQKKKDGQERDGKHKLFPKIAEVHNVLKKQKQTNKQNTHARTHTHTRTRTRTRTKTSLTVDIQFDNLEQIPVFFFLTQACCYKAHTEEERDPCSQGDIQLDNLNTERTALVHYTQMPTKHNP